MDGERLPKLADTTHLANFEEEIREEGKISTADALKNARTNPDTTDYGDFEMEFKEEAKVSLADVLENAMYKGRSC